QFLSRFFNVFSELAIFMTRVPAKARNIGSRSLRVNPFGQTATQGDKLLTAGVNVTWHSGSARARLDHLSASPKGRLAEKAMAKRPKKGGCDVQKTRVGLAGAVAERAGHGRRRQRHHRLGREGRQRRADKNAAA